MGNPGLPDPRVAPRVSPSLLTFPPTLLFPRSLVRIVSLLPSPSPRTHILLVSIHPLVPTPSADLNDIFEGKFRRNRGKHFVLRAASLLLFFLPPRQEYTPRSSVCPPLLFPEVEQTEFDRPLDTTPSSRYPLHHRVSYSGWNGDSHLGAVVENVLRVDIAANRG